jgi:hypothetical protein
MQATSRSRVHFAWQRPNVWEVFRSGVSLHSHTSHSRETLDFIPRLSRAVPLLREAVEAQERRYRRIHGREIDYFGAWWTPPLGPREALAVERGQIEERLGLQPLVSLSDHDNIEAPLLLRALEEGRDTPVSLEWTVPWAGTFFHLGVHNLPPRRAAHRMAALAEFTRNPRPEELEGLLDWIVEDPHTLVVFNHPCWDEKGIGHQAHCREAAAFARRFRTAIHAIELNGLRPWSENRLNVALADSLDLPVISGGDRHTTEPNALVNLTNAATFGEFVEEVRDYGYSHVLVMPQYREPLSLRIMHAIADVMKDNEGHTHGWTRWTDRVFFRRATGQVSSLADSWRAGGQPVIVSAFAGLARLAGTPPMRVALRQLSEPVQELVL